MSEISDEKPTGQHSASATGTDVLPAGQAETLFPDPGLPPHEKRLTDVDRRVAKRTERQVAGMFGLSALSTIAFAVCYFAIDADQFVYIWPFGEVSASNFSLGLTLGLALLGIGVGAIHWARALMGDVELVEQRHYPIRSSEPDREAALEAFRAGVEDSAIGRYPLIRRSLLAAMGLLPVAAVVPLVGLANKGLGSNNVQQPLRRTAWAKHPLIINENTGKPFRPEDLTLNSMAFGKPEGVHEVTEMAKASIVLVRLDPAVIKNEQQKEWGHEGIVAFSKICTHVGCPIGLYEQSTHHMLCPCHQSTFDMTDGAKVIFGPAKRALPQLKIQVNDEGYLVAAQDFAEPVGPSFWERKA